MLKKVIALMVLSSILLGCNKRLDSFLFNPTQLSEYALDNFSGPVSLDLYGQYNVPLEKIHEISFTIQQDSDPLEIFGIYTGDLNNIATDTVILYCHGNRDHIDFYWPRQKIYSNLGGPSRYGVFMIDYPGYGKSEGSPSEEGMYESVKGALQWLKNQGLTDDRLIMIGFSLGSAPVCKVAGEKDFPLVPSRIILEAPFASAEKMIQDAALLAMPSSYFVNLEINNAELIQFVETPLFWIHGEADDFLEIEKHGRIVYLNHGGLSHSYVTVPGGGHESTPAVYGFANYSQAFLNFIQGN